MDCMNRQVKRMPNVNVKYTIRASVRGVITDKQVLRIVLNMEELEREALAYLIKGVKDIGFDNVEVTDAEVYFD